VKRVRHSFLNSGSVWLRTGRVGTWPSTQAGRPSGGFFDTINGINGIFLAPSTPTRSARRVCAAQAYLH